LLGGAAGDLWLGDGADLLGGGHGGWEVATAGWNWLRPAGTAGLGHNEGRRSGGGVEDFRGKKK